MEPVDQGLQQENPKKPLAEANRSTEQLWTASKTEVKYD